MKATAVKIDMNELQKAFSESPTIRSLFTVMDDCEEMIKKSETESATKKTRPDKPDDITKYVVTVQLKDGDNLYDISILSKVVAVQLDDSVTTLRLKDMRSNEFYEFTGHIKTAKLQDKFRIYYSVKTVTKDGEIVTDAVQLD